MSRSRRRPVPSLLSLWKESDRAHACEALVDAIADAAYEVVVTYARGRRISRRKRERDRRVLVVIPNALDVVPLRDRLRFCPFCGWRMPLVNAPPKQTKGSAVIIPSAMPEDF